MIISNIKNNNDRALLITSSSLFNDDDNWSPVTCGKLKFAPWGINNDEPQRVLSLVEKADVMASNLTFNVSVSYGLGPRLMRIKRDNEGREIERIPVTSGKEYDFFMRNDIPMFFLEMITDMNYFHNAFVELIFDKEFKQIYSLRCKEATFSRWLINNKNEIVGHGYSNIWDESPSDKDIIVSKVLDEFDTLRELKLSQTLRTKNDSRLIYPIYMPCPGRPYYSRPSWYSLFNSGWYDLNRSIPAIKKAILENQLGVKFIIYISPKYFEKLASERGINITDLQAMKELHESEVKKMNEFLAGGENLSKSMTSFAEYVPTGSGVNVEKYITIEPINNKMNGGEFITDAETSANVICYAMGIHQGLIGAAPGKSSGSMSGTDKRELYLIKQAIMKPMLDRCLKIFSIVKEFNNWDKEIYIEIPEYIFTSLDENKTGKTESTTKEV